MFKDYDLRSKENAMVQQISSYNKQKLENEKEPKLKTCITGTEKDGQNVSRIPNQRKVSQILRPIKNENDITNRQNSIEKGCNIAIHQQSAQRRNTIQYLSVPVELVHPEPIPQEEDQNVSAAGDRGDQNGIKESMNVD